MDQTVSSGVASNPLIQGIFVSGGESVYVNALRYVCSVEFPSKPCVVPSQFNSLRPVTCNFTVVEFGLFIDMLF